MKDLRYLQLWDAYGALLTDTQRDICELYYMCDLSLTEIAEQKGVSKQSVSDSLKKARELLDYYEEKLHHNALNQKVSLEVSLMMTEIVSALDKFAQLHPEHAEEIKNIVKLVSVGDTIDLDEEE